MAEEDFREIQLSGKQLVFLFMATTMVSVVIFLLGVFVGRGVRAETVVADATGTTIEGLTETPAAAEPGKPAGEPPPAVQEPDQFSYHQRLQQPAVPQENVQPPAAATPPPAAQQAEPAPPAAPAPASSGWVAQIGAYNERSAAENVQAMLKRNGFPAFILPPSPGSPTRTFRVRVGPYAARGDADAVAARLQREHQFTPFVTR